MAVQGVPQLDRLSAIECKTDTSFDITTMKVESFDFQYYLLYKSRLERLRPILENSARHQWGKQLKQLCNILAQTKDLFYLQFCSDIFHDKIIKTFLGHKYNLCSRVLDAETSVKGREVVIFGTLYKEMKKKKSVLDEYHDVCHVNLFSLAFFGILIFCIFFCFLFLVFRLVWTLHIL